MPFEISKPLRFGDCDLTGIAYHPAYLSMLVDVNEAMFASFGVTWHELMTKRSTGMPVLFLNLAFSKPTTYGDVLDFAMHVRKLGRSSMDLETIVTVRATEVWRVNQKIVCTSTIDHKSQPWPDDVRQGLMRYFEPVEN